MKSCINLLILGLLFIGPSLSFAKQSVQSRRGLSDFAPQFTYSSVQQLKEEGLTEIPTATQMKGHGGHTSDVQRVALKKDYMSRIKERLSGYWSASVNERFRNKRSLSSSNDKPVTVKFTILPDGAVSKAEVSNSSGIELLDSAALMTLNKAAIFTPPPKDLLDNNGHLQLTWNFVISQKKQPTDFWGNPE